MGFYRTVLSIYLSGMCKATPTLFCLITGKLQSLNPPEVYVVLIAMSYKSFYQCVISCETELFYDRRCCCIETTTTRTTSTTTTTQHLLIITGWRHIWNAPQSLKPKKETENSKNQKPKTVKNTPQNWFKAISFEPQLANLQTSWQLDNL